jgi:peptidyl-prolyl cis-trans isomerase B (cyclophilin B)
MKNLLYLLLFSTLFSCATDKDYLVTIKTEYGDMHAILYDETPKHKDNFIKLAQEGFYDSTLFHRVMKEFMVQGGDPNSKGIAPGARLGNGGPGYNIPAEFNKKYYHEKGALAAARQPDQVNPERESSGSQFYIVQGQSLD